MQLQTAKNTFCRKTTTILNKTPQDTKVEDSKQNNNENTDKTEKKNNTNKSNESVKRDESKSTYNENDSIHIYNINQTGNITPTLNKISQSTNVENRQQ